MNTESFHQKLCMPAEWEAHSATLLSWPSNKETWPGERLERVENVYLDIIKTLSRFEKIVLLLEDEKIKKRVERLFSNADIDLHQVQLQVYPINDIWARDCGPIFVKQGSEYVITDWEYNTWGEKYPPWDSDNNIPSFIADNFDIKYVNTEMVLEGGSIDVNGIGDLLTTESVLLNPNRNPSISKEEIEQNLRAFLGARNIIWLKEGLAGDDTDGHIDDLTRFLNEETVLTMLCEDEHDVNYDVLQENLTILRASKLANGKSLNIETLPLPKTRIVGTTVDGSEFVPASYANFYIANGCVLIPLYDERYDEQAMELFKKYFPDREVIGIECADLVWGQGSIHCITQQLYIFNGY